MGANHSIPNDHLSNYPTPDALYLGATPYSTGPDASYSSWNTSESEDGLLLSDNRTEGILWWPTGLAWLLQIEVTIFTIVTVIGVFVHRRTFPINIQPIHLVLAMCVMQPVVAFSYNGHILWPNMPCIMHIVIHNALMFPLTGIAFCMSLRQYIAYNAQFDMAAGKLDTWFVKKKDILKGYIFDATVIAVCGLIFSAFFFSRLIGVRDYDYSVLMLPIKDVRCGSLSTVQFVLRIVNTFINLRMQKKVTIMAKDVKEPFPFRKLYQLITKNNARFILCYDLAYIFKEFWVGIDPTLFAKIAWAGSFIWAFVFCHNFQAFMAWGMIRGAMNTNDRKKHLLRVSLSSSHQSSKTGDTSSSFKRVKTIAQIRDQLVEDKELREQFKQYLVREFCVENMLFICAVLEYREAVGTPAVVQIALDIEEKYIRENAVFEVNVSSALRKKVSQELRQQAEMEKSNPKIGALSLELLAQVEDEIYKMMIDPYNRFQFRRSTSDPDLSKSRSLPGIMTASTEHPKLASVSNKKEKSSGGGVLQLLVQKKPHHAEVAPASSASAQRINISQNSSTVDSAGLDGGGVQKTSSNVLLSSSPMKKKTSSSPVVVAPVVNDLIS